MVAQQTLNATSTSVILNNLTTGVAYVARLVAFTRVGLGPYSAPFQLLMDPTLLPQKPARLAGGGKVDVAISLLGHT